MLLASAHFDDDSPVGGQGRCAVVGHGQDEMDGLARRIGRDGNASVALDSRARGTCPLCRYGLEALDSAFVAVASRAYDLLMQNADCSAYLRALSETCTL